MSGIICPVCGAESEEIYRCSECGKLFDGDETSGNGQRRLGGR